MPGKFTIKAASGSTALFSPLAIAPMIDWTYPQFRYVMRLLAPKALLYTEMKSPGAIMYNPGRSLAYDAIEHPVALQIGGANPKALADCAKVAEEKGFDEINLNLGCPSDKVQSGRFGACMMADPENAAACIRAMKNAVSIPVTAKTRIGIDTQDSYEFFSNFAHKLVDAGADKLIVHARKAWLNGLSPKQNRNIPPVNYDHVYRFKQENPATPVVINGNIISVSEMQTHLQQVDGVMIGRLVCRQPYLLSAFHQVLYPDSPILSRVSVLTQWVDYAQAQAADGVSLAFLFKPIQNLAHGLPNARLWNKALSDALKSGKLPPSDTLIGLMKELEQFNHGILADFLVN